MASRKPTPKAQPSTRTTVVAERTTAQRIKAVELVRKVLDKQQVRLLDLMVLDTVDAVLAEGVLHVGDALGDDADLSSLREQLYAATCHDIATDPERPVSRAIGELINTIAARIERCAAEPDSSAPEA